MGKRIIRKSLSLLLSFAFLISVVPTTVQADGRGTGNAGGFQPFFYKYIELSPNNNSYTNPKTRRDKEMKWAVDKSVPEGVSRTELQNICGNSKWAIIATVGTDNKYNQRTFAFSEKASNFNDYSAGGLLSLQTHTVAGLYRSIPRYVVNKEEREAWAGGMKSIAPSKSSDMKLKKGPDHQTETIATIIARRMRSSNPNKYRIICSKQFFREKIPTFKKIDKPCPASTPRNKEVVKGNWKPGGKGSFDYNMPTSYTFTITPVKPSNFYELDKEQRDAWTRTHHTQTETFQTEYGKLLKELDKSGILQKLRDPAKAKLILEANRKKIEEAIQRDKKLNYTTRGLQLSANNQEGFNRGGAFTIKTSKKMARISMGYETEVSDVIKCTEYSVPMTKKGYNADFCETKVTSTDGICRYNEIRHKITTVGKKERAKTNTNTSTYAVIKESPYPQDDGTFQIINVLCNNEEAKKMFARWGITNIKKYGNAMFGKTRKKALSDLPVKQSSLSTTFFYGGDCDSSIKCSPSANRNNPYSDVRNNKIDASATVINGAPKYGAQVNNINSSELQFFRDGKNNTVRMDVWHLTTKPGAGVVIPKVAVRTDLSLWGGSTPEYVSDNSGMLSLYNVNNSPLNMTKKNGNFYKAFNGEVNKFVISSQWASEGATDTEKARPVIFANSYHYKPELQSLVATKVTMDGEVITQQKNAPISATCDSVFNRKNAVPARVGILPTYVAPKIAEYNIYNDKDSKLLINFVKSAVE